MRRMVASSMGLVLVMACSANDDSVQRVVVHVDQTCLDGVVYYVTHMQYGLVDIGESLAPKYKPFSHYPETCL